MVPAGIIPCLSLGQSFRASGPRCHSWARHPCDRMACWFPAHSLALPLLRVQTSVSACTWSTAIGNTDLIMILSRCRHAQSLASALFSDARDQRHGSDLLCPSLKHRGIRFSSENNHVMTCVSSSLLDLLGFQSALLVTRHSSCSSSLEHGVPSSQSLCLYTPLQPSELSEAIVSGHLHVGLNY